MIKSQPVHPTRSIVSIFIALAVLVLAAAAAHAQWTTPDASQNINNTNTGNVGVGTATPGYRLEVVGASPWIARFRKTDNTNGGIIIDSTPGFNPNLALTVNGVNKWYLLSNSSNSDKLQFWESSGNFPRFTLTQAGSVGIGITTPLYSLDVNGGVNGFRAKAATTSANDTIATFENGSAIQMIVRGDGKVGIGRTDPGKTLDVVGDINASGTITAGNIKANYQDLAEWVDSSQPLSAGTVVVLNPAKSNQVIASSQSYDSRVAGVISLQPGIALGAEGKGRVLVATTGRVKVKVDASNGPINIGDLLVTSDIEGIAMKSVPVEFGGVHMHRPGTLIGKALEPLASGRGEILVLLSLQ